MADEDETESLPPKPSISPFMKNVRRYYRKYFMTPTLYTTRYDPEKYSSFGKGGKKLSRQQIKKQKICYFVDQLCQKSVENVADYRVKSYYAIIIQRHYRFSSFYLYFGVECNCIFVV